MRQVRLEYGTDGMVIDLPGSNTTVLNPTFIDGIPDEQAGFFAAVRAPIQSRPLGETVASSERLAIVVPDITRPLPSDRLLPWVFAELSHVPEGNVTIVNGTGSHRVNTPEELASMLGRKILEKYRVVNHNAHDPATLEPAGRGADGRTVLMNREYVRADRRIVLGFIEPHFMAGFSGGYKAVFPGVADIASIMHYHRASVIGDPNSTWGVLEGNPTQEQIRGNGSLLPIDFCINVTLNRYRAITGFFCGDTLAAHREGAAFARATAMVPCERPYAVVVTTNGGYPLDQNLYQAVKGMSAAAQIVEQGGLIVAASRCNDGFPAHGNFRQLLFEHASAAAILRTISAPGFSMYDQWEAQLLAIIRQKARIGLFSEITPAEVAGAHLDPVFDIGAYVAEELKVIGPDAPVAVLPEGPMTIPYLI
jgi:lactate racemase